MTHGDKFDQLVKLYEDAFKNHTLSMTPEGYWRMSNTSSSFYLTNILFVAGRTIIFGDACVGGENDNGVISNCGYALEWFASDLHPDYLASKFYARRWDKDAAEAWVRGNLDDPGDRPERELECLRAILDDGEFTEHSFEENDWGNCAPDGDDWPRSDYDTAHAAMLHVIQKTFARLWKEAPDADR